MPGVDISDTNYLSGYQQGMLLEQFLKQCGNDLSRENIIKQAKSLKDCAFRPRCRASRSTPAPKINMVWTQMRLQRWNGTSWELFE